MTYVLGSEDNNWTRDRVKKVVDAKERKVVYLDAPMTLHILYRTEIATPDGVVRFGDDVYGRDRLRANALFES